MMIGRRVLMLILLIKVLSGCGNKDAILPAPAHTMQSIYQQHSASSNVPVKPQTVPLALCVDAGNSHGPASESSAASAPWPRPFHKLANPTLSMYVAPHLATESQVPVPGYTTEFSMWVRDHYALPGEVREQSDQPSRCQQ